MPRFDNRDLCGATFDAPSGWSESSVFTTTAPGPAPQPTITLARLPMPPDSSLELFAARRVADLTAVVADLRVEESREVVFGGQRGILLRLRWEEPEGSVAQRLVFAKIGGAIFMLTLHGLEAQAEAQVPTFDAMVASFRAPLAMTAR